MLFVGSRWTIALMAIFCRRYVEVSTYCRLEYYMSTLPPSLRRALFCSHVLSSAYGRINRGSMLHIFFTEATAVTERGN